MNYDAKGIPMDYEAQQDALIALLKRLLIDGPDVVEKDLEEKFKVEKERFDAERAAASKKEKEEKPCEDTDITCEDCEYHMTASWCAKAINHDPKINKDYETGWMDGYDAKENENVWIPVGEGFEDSYPEDNSFYLVACKDKEAYITTKGVWRSKYHIWEVYTPFGLKLKGPTEIVAYTNIPEYKEQRSI